MKSKIITISFIITFIFIFTLLFIGIDKLEGQIKRTIIINSNGIISTLEIITLPHDSSHFYIYYQNDKMIEIIIRDHFWTMRGEEWDTDKKTIELLFGNNKDILKPEPKTIDYWDVD